METRALDDIAKRFASLPPALQEAIRSAGLRDKLAAVARKFKLHIDQGAALENETILVMLGLQTPLEYAESLKAEAGVSESVAYDIAEEVSKEIFLPIREHLKKIFEEEAERAQGKASAQAENIKPQGEVEIPKNLPGQDEVVERPEDILAAIERPESLKTNLPPAPEAPARQSPPPSKNLESKTPPASTPPTPPPAKDGAQNPLRSPRLPSEEREIGKTRPTDPYREPID